MARVKGGLNAKKKHNRVWNEEKQELTPSSCEAFYHEKDNKVYITPEVIAM